MKKIKVTISPWIGNDRVSEIRECKTGYPFLKDYRALKTALSEFQRVKMEEMEDGQDI